MGYFWKSCTCVEGECVGADGNCHPSSYAFTVKSWLRLKGIPMFFSLICCLRGKLIVKVIKYFTGLDVFDKMFAIQDDAQPYNQLQTPGPVWELQEFNAIV